MKKCEFEKQIDNYLLDRLSEKEKSAFEEHFFNCPICSKELIFREKILETIREKGREIFTDIISQTHIPTKIYLFNKFTQFFRVRKWVFASLIIFLLIFGSATYYLYYKLTHPPFFSPSGEVLRGEIIKLFYPQGELQEYPKLFYWKKIEGASKYLFSIFDNKTNLIWKIKTKNNKIKLPDKIRTVIKKGSFYFWEVKALSSQGSVIAQSRRAIFRII
jgi:hypothetical protein